MTTDFQLQVLSADDLLQRPNLLSATASLVNNSYLDHEDFNGTLRFEFDEKLCSELADTGFCAVLLEGEDNPVATASVKPWRITDSFDEETMVGLIGSDVKDPSNEHNLELFAVATRNGMKYRKKGLAELCVRALESHLLAQLRTDETDIRLTFWVRVVEGINVEYWRRRGFCQVGQGVILPIGTWSSSDPFLLITMNKSATKSG